METGEVFWHIFAIIGAIKIACMLFPWLYWKSFCSISLSNYKYGYVLITGATDSIGKALVIYIVSIKFSVKYVVIIRSEMRRILFKYMLPTTLLTYNNC